MLFEFRGEFVMEYVGEVLDYKTFKARTKQYAKSGESHFYFMALNADEVIDASYRGNISRFINHSCDPNCETQKVGDEILICMLYIKQVEVHFVNVVLVHS